MPAPTSNTDEIAERREKTARKNGLALAHQMTVDRHGNDVLGHVRPSSRVEREQEKDAARATCAHLADLGLVGIYPAWLVESDVA